MPLDKQFCKRQIERLEGLPFYASIGSNGFTELVGTLQNFSASESIAKAAIDALLFDQPRASNSETNRVPSPGELRLWIEAQSPETLDDQRPEGRYCGHCERGWIRHATVFRGNRYEGVRRCECQGVTA